MYAPAPNIPAVHAQVGDCPAVRAYYIRTNGHLPGNPPPLDAQTVVQVACETATRAHIELDATPTPSMYETHPAGSIWGAIVNLTAPRAGDITHTRYRIVRYLHVVRGGPTNYNN